MNWNEQQLALGISLEPAKSPNWEWGEGSSSMPRDHLHMLNAVWGQLGSEWASLVCIFLHKYLEKYYSFLFFFLKFKQVSAFIPPLFGFAIYLYFWLCGVFLEACSVWDPLLRCVGSVAAVLGLGHPKAYGIFSSLIRDGTLLPLYWRWILNPWTTRQVLKNTILKLTS